MAAVIDRRTRGTLLGAALAGHLAVGAKVVGEHARVDAWYAPVATLPGFLALSLLGAAGAVAFWRGRAGAAGLLFGVLALGARLDLAVRDTTMPGLETVLAGALLAGWLAGWTWGREKAAHEAACGVFGACLVLAAVAKLDAAGLGWLAAGPQAHTVLERALDTWGPLRGLRLAVAAHPALCAAGAGCTLAVELAGVGWVLPRARGVLAALTVGLFAGLALVLGIWQPGWALAAVGLAGRRPGERPPAARGTGTAVSATPYR